MNHRHLLFALATLLATSCLTEGNYPTKLGATFCKKYKECNPDEFDAEYDSVSDCKNTAKEQFSDSDSDSGDCLKDAGCKFDGSAASACRKSIADSACGADLTSTYLGDCAEIYDCSEADSTAVSECFTIQ